MDDCLRSRNLVNVIVAGKQPSPQWLDMDAAIKHCSTGIGIWNWASSDRDTMPDVVMACCGDVPTLETLAAVALLREHVPDPRVRGYKEESTTTTPFDMVVRNDLARYDLVADVVDRVERLAPIAAYAKQVVRDKLVEHHAYIERHGEDLPAIRDWVWPY